MRTPWFVAAAAGIALISWSAKARAPLIVWNASPSVAVGFYVIRRTPPRRSDLALIRLKTRDSDIVRRRGYLTGTTLLLKPVRAIERDRVCRFGTVVLVGRQTVAKARLRDAAGRPLPTWFGCRNLQPGELFLISSADTSFDSRYLGVIKAEQVVGAAERYVEPD